MRDLTKSSAFVLFFTALMFAVLGSGCASGSTEPADGGPRPDANRDGGRGPDGALDGGDGGGGEACTIADDCDDHDACNGVETCVASLCRPGSVVSCDDAVNCTNDTCDTGDGTCTNVPDDTRCGTGLACDRVEGCAPPRECTIDEDCDDTIFCNGVERCDLAFGCRRGDVPNCDDGSACTVDACDAATDVCASMADDTHCDDALVCNGAEVCAPADPAADGEGCAPGVALVCDDSVPCTLDTCDEAAAGCVSTPSAAACDDGVFCNGAETCDPTMGGCQPGTTPTCDDTIGCSVGRCDTATDACTQDANDAACSDSRLCNGSERCDVTGTTPGSGCVPGAAIDCSDGMSCTTDGCAEPGMCTHGGSDVDADGFTARGCATGNDCDDLSPRINPSAAEICDGIDNDCSGTGAFPSGVDDGTGMQCPFGSAPRSCTTSCMTAGTQPCDGACRLGLCRAVAETCNGCDDDGDGQIDEPGGGSPVQCRAGDVRSCTVSGCGTLGTQTCSTGCSWDRCVATEVCNTCDDDGDGMVDDGFTVGGTCSVGVGECVRSGTVVCRSDGTGTVCSASSGAPIAELCNGRDDNCNGTTDEAFTELGMACTVGVGACRRTGAFICRGDATGTVCSATAAMPGTETCNGMDDDCDGTVDDGADAGACDGADLDSCTEGTNRCMGGALVCDDATGNNAETCNMVDDNCNGTTDEGCACTLGATRMCYGGPPGTAGVGICQNGTQTCVAIMGGGSMWGTCSGAVTPVAEVCNGLDDDCVSGVDNGNPGGGAACDGTDSDSCLEGTRTCTAGALVCSDMTSGTVETCNGIDDDCAGGVDNGLSSAPCDGPDGDACLEGTSSCSMGMMTCSDATPNSVEICNNVDDDCDGVADDGNPGGGAACDGGDTDLCTDGTIVCSSGALSCNDGATSTTEICGNGIDDDCNGSTPDVCTIPGDTCGTGGAGAILLSGTGGSRSDTLVGATAQTTDCGSGVEVFYRIVVSAPSIIYLSTLSGTSFDTRISYRGTTCPGTTGQCIDDSCGTLQTHLAQFVPAGTHYFAVHSFYSGTVPGPYGLAYGVYAAAGGTNTAVSPTPTSGTMMSFAGTTVGAANGVTPACGSSTAGENSYYWLQCPADSRAYAASMCGGTAWDSIVHMRLNGASIACNDDFCGSFGLSAFTGATSSGAGLVQLFVDGYGGGSGAYTVNTTF